MLEEQNALSEPAPVHDFVTTGGSVPAAERAAVADPARYQEAALAWIRQNQTAAMIAGFAVGVFVGVLMRD